MSKSLGNGIDPLEIISQYGADALRFALATGNSPGNDMRFSDEKIEAARNFANKLWNASRFVLMNLDIESIELPPEMELAIEDKWILSKLKKTAASVNQNLDKFEIGIALSTVYDFVWDVFCDWYIELAKPSMTDHSSPRSKNTQSVLAYVLREILTMLHPFMPFITEEIYSYLPSGEETIMLRRFTEADGVPSFPEDEEKLERVIGAIRAIRARRAEMNVPPSKKAKISVVTKYPEAFSESVYPFFERLAFASGVELCDSYTDDSAVQIITDSATVYIPLAEIVDFEAERKRLNSELDSVKAEIARAEGKLANENFTSRAPAAVVDAERAKLAKYNEKMEGIVRALEALPL